MNLEAAEAAVERRRLDDGGDDDGETPRELRIDADAIVLFLFLAPPPLASVEVLEQFEEVDEDLDLDRSTVRFRALFFV